jgi:hypothetical protein
VLFAGARVTTDVRIGRHAHVNQNGRPRLHPLGLCHRASVGGRLRRRGDRPGRHGGGGGSGPPRRHGWRRSQGGRGIMRRARRCCDMGLHGRSWALMRP